MEFDKLRFKSSLVRSKVAKTIELCQDIKTNGPKQISTDEIELIVGQGETGRILRQVLLKQKNAASKKGIPATWEVDNNAFCSLCAALKKFASRRTTLDEVVTQREI